MNYANLIEGQDENREAIGQAFADAGTESRAVKTARRRKAKAAVKTSQAKAFEDAVEAHLAKTTEGEEAPETNGL